MNKIEYDYAIIDYLIDNKLLLPHLKQHEQVILGNYISALLSQSLANERLNNHSEPDLINGHIAI